MPQALPLLALFHRRLGDSRLAELEAVAHRLGARDVPWAWRPQILHNRGGDMGPSQLQPLPAVEEADLGWLADAAALSVACRGVFEVWGAGDTVEDCAAEAACLPAEHVLARIPISWRVDSLVLGSRRSQHGGSLDARMEAFGGLLDVLAARPVDLRAAGSRLWLVEDRRVLEGGAPLPEASPRYLLLYELPASRPSLEDLAHRLDLRGRAFLSTSSLPAYRALLLSNLALANAPLVGASMLDPYCGSGSTLLAGAALGAETVGSDLDWRMVSDIPWPVQIPPSRWRPQRGEERVCMRDNFDEAGLPAPKALLTLDVSDAHAAERLLEANGGQPYDALVCDPPYGRREFQQGAEGWAGGLSFKVDEAALEGTLATLLDLARATLRPGGRLVFLAPVRSPRDPSKPALERLRATLEGPAGKDLRLVHLGVEAVHRALHRAVVVLERLPA